MACMSRSVFVLAVTSANWHTRRADLDVSARATRIGGMYVMPEDEVVTV